METPELFIDIHTHNLEINHYISIVNILVNDDLTDLSIFRKVKANNPKTYFSAGIHPWHLDKERSLIDKLKEIICRIDPIAIGECGLDKKIKTPIAEQVELFQFQISISEEIHKPVIIHCVRSYNELIKLRKETKSTMPWVVHGFNGNLLTANQCIKHGMMVSFGKNLFNDKSNAVSVIERLPLNTFFLETDESNLSIEEIYLKCAEIKGISIDMLKTEMARNFNNCFKC